MVAKTMKEVAMRFDIYRNEIVQSPLATSTSSQSMSTESNLFVEPVTRR